MFKKMDSMLPLKGVVTLGVIFMMYVISGCHAQNIIGPTDDTQAVLRGNSHTLSCSRQTGFTHFVSWFDAIPGGAALQISIGGDIIAPGDKYTNLAIESPDEDTFNLVIDNAVDANEGFYYCQIVGTSTTSLTVTFTVEVESTSMAMTQDGNPVSEVTMTVGEPSEMVCTSLGTRPIVDIWWYQSDEKIMTGVTQTNTSNGDGTFDTVSTLQYTPSSKDDNNARLRCVSTGQIVAQPVTAEATLNVQYVPIVSVQYGSDTVVCSSDANPTVLAEDYTVIVNGTDEYDPVCTDGECTHFLKVDFATHVRCNASNAVGTGTAFTTAEPGALITTTPSPSTESTGDGGTTPSPSSESTGDGGVVVCQNNIFIALLVILSLLLAVSLAVNIGIFIRYNRLVNATDKTSDTQMESRMSGSTNQGANLGGEKYQELNINTREKEHAYQQPNLAGHKRDVENEQGPMYEDLKSPSEEDKQPVYEVAESEVNAVNNKPKSPMYVNARPTRPRHGKNT